MNISEAIGIEILAGGPGSGPNAPCPECGPHHKQIDEGDTVRLKKEVSLYNKRTGNNDKLPAGQKAVVVGVLPKIGNAEQMVKVNVLAPSKHHEESLEHVKMADVELHKSGLTHQVNPIGKQDLPMYSKPGFHPTAPGWKELDIQQVKKSQVLMKTKTSDGANLTVVRPKSEKESDPKTLKDLAKTPSPFKGTFNPIETVSGADNQTTRIYETGKASYAHEKEGPGAVVWVHQYLGKLVIQEQSYLRWSQKRQGLISFEYKNRAAGLGMLKKRYGIKIGLREKF
jgi:hypothetical protein